MDTNKPRMDQFTPDELSEIKQEYIDHQHMVRDYISSATRRGTRGFFDRIYRNRFLTSPEAVGWTLAEAVTMNILALKEFITRENQ